MESNSKLAQWFSRIGEKLNDQVWFQQLKSKWEEMDPQSRFYLKAASGGAAVLLALILVFSSMWNVHKKKKEFAEKMEIVSMIQSANDEMRRVKETLPAGSQIGTQPKTPAPGAASPWPPYLESLAANAGIEKASLSVASEKPGATTDQATESLLEIALKHVNIKQVVRYAFYLENGARAMKLRNLTIDTKSDPTGYLDATLAVSGFTLK